MSEVAVANAELRVDVIAHLVGDPFLLLVVAEAIIHLAKTIVVSETTIDVTVTVLEAQMIEIVR